MNRKITKNYIYNLIQQVLLVISPVITIPFLSRSLGADGIGQYSYAFALTNYFTLVATLGCDVYGRREISYVKESIDERSKKFWSIQIIKTICTFFVIIVYILFSSFNANRILLYILTFHLINVPLNIGWFYQGIEKFKKITIRSFVLKIVELLFVIFCIHSPSDLTLYVFGSSFINFVAFFVLWVDIKVDVKLVPIKQINIKKDLSECIIFFLPSIATSIYTLLDKTMLGVLTGDYTENGYYEQAQKINVILLRVVLALGLVLLPQIANSFKKGEKEAVKNFINKSGRYVFFISFPIAIGLICISNNFVPWFFGDGFEQVSILLKISGFILIVQGLDDVFGMQYLVSVDRQKEYIISLFIGAMVNFICNLIFIPKFYAVGAIIASFIGEFVIICVQMFFVRKDISLIDFYSNCKNYVIASVAMIGIIPITNKLPSSILNTIIIIFIGGGIYMITLVILKDKLICDVIDNLKNKFNLKEKVKRYE